MGWAAATGRKGTVWLILAALLLGLSACGNTIPNTGAQEEAQQDALRLAEPALSAADAALTPAAGDLFCSILRYPSLNDLTTYQNAQLAEPPPRQPFYDPVFGSCIARLTDRTADRAPFDASTGLRAPGAGAQAFNANSTRILIQSNAGYWYVYDAQTLLPMLNLPFEGADEVFWDPIDPDLLFYLHGTSLLRYSLVDTQERLVHNFSVSFPNQSLDRVSAQGGTVSEDGQTWGLAGLDESGNALLLMVYDFSADAVTSHQHFPAPVHLRGLRTSPSGSYLLAGFSTICPDIQSGGETLLCGLAAFNRDFTVARHVTGAPGSFDIALDPLKREVVVYHDQAAQSISMFDLRKGERRALLLVEIGSSAMNLEVSGQALDRPGWALASFYSVPTPGQGTWLDGTILAFELKSDGLIARLAQNHSIYADPNESGWVHPGASPNRDFTRVLFSSNWGNASGEIETYIIALPGDWSNPGQ